VPSVPSHRMRGSEDCSCKVVQFGSRVRHCRPARVGPVRRHRVTFQMRRAIAGHLQKLVHRAREIVGSNLRNHLRHAAAWLGDPLEIPTDQRPSTSSRSRARRRLAGTRSLHRHSRSTRPEARCHLVVRDHPARALGSCSRGSPPVPRRPVASRPAPGSRGGMPSLRAPSTRRRSLMEVGPRWLPRHSSVIVGRLPRQPGSRTAPVEAGQGATGRHYLSQFDGRRSLGLAGVRSLSWTR